MSDDRGSPGARPSGGPRLEPPRPCDALAEEVDLPATTRIARGRSPDRTLRAATLLAVAAIGLALVKPWAWGAPATPSPGPDGTVAPRPAPTAAATPAPRTWTDLDANVSCFSNRLWMAVVDEAGDGGRTMTRSWTRLDPVPAAGPTDPRIVRAHAYADAVPRIGFCAPTAASGTGRAAGSGGRLEVAAWRVERGGAPDAAAVPIDLAVVAGGTVADGGALYGAPASLRRGLGPGDPTTTGGGGGPGPTGGSGDPEAAWSADGDAPWRPTGWAIGPAFADGGWPPGTYVFRVAVGGLATGGSAEAWFAVELRGPWLGPGGGAPGRGTPDATPGAELVPAPAPSVPAP